MATHLVWHEVSHVVVELSEDDLASPLGYLYHPVKTNKRGKHYIDREGNPVLLDGRNSHYSDPQLLPIPVEDDDADIADPPAKVEDEPVTGDPQPDVKIESKK